MSAPKIKLKNNSRDFRNHELFFSTTNEKGIITGCNDVFIRVADYEPADILLKPHNIVRHPEMPRAVFKLLWDYLEAGKTIGAYVKNLAATGEYYWVYALACPINGGYLSIRFKPSSPIFDVVQSLYAEILKVESSYGREERREGLEASFAKMVQRVGELGFPSYDHFMFESLRQEIELCGAAIEDSVLNEAKRAGKTPIGETLSGFSALRSDLAEKAKNLGLFVKKLHHLSVNASVRARHVGQAGRALGVIGEEISRASNSLKQQIGSFGDQVTDLSSALQKTSFELAMAFLQASMAQNFANYQSKNVISEEVQIEKFGQKLNDLGEILRNCELQSATAARQTLTRLSGTMVQFDQFIEFLDKLILTLQFGYVTGQAEVAGIADDKGFSLLLQDLQSSSEQARDELDKLRISVRSVSDAIVQPAQ